MVRLLGGYISLRGYRDVFMLCVYCFIIKGGFIYDI
jgi:hypothetical protein